jgi:hypothetical protein
MEQRSTHVRKVRYPGNYIFPLSERVPHRNETANFRHSDIPTGSNIWSQVPQGCSTPRLTDHQL